MAKIRLPHGPGLDCAAWPPAQHQAEAQRDPSCPLLGPCWLCLHVDSSWFYGGGAAAPNKGPTYLLAARPGQWHPTD